jgi:hypothetical protein
MPLAAPIVAAIIGGGASIAGGALANRGSQQSGTAPTVAPEYKGLQDMVLAMTQKRLQNPIDTAGYTANGVANINRASDLTRMNTENALAARGLSGSPIAGNAAATAETGRAGQVAGFENSIPLMVDQLQTQRLNDANQVLAGGRGTNYTGESQYGGGAGGAFTNLASMIGYLTGKGVFNKPGGASNGLPGQMPMPGAFGTSGAY